MAFVHERRRCPMHENQHRSIDEDEWTPQQPRLWLHRSLVIALSLSFLASLVMLWLTGTLLGGADQLLPSSLLQVVVDHRVVALVIPFACLIACYGALRRLTGEIMAVPERYLDERQKAMRDQAHRPAFTIIKLSCFVIPALLLAQYLPWFHPSPTWPPFSGIIAEYNHKSGALISVTIVPPSVPVSSASASPTEIALPVNKSGALISVTIVPP